MRSTSCALRLCQRRPRQLVGVDHCDEAAAPELSQAKRYSHGLVADRLHGVTFWGAERRLAAAPRLSARER